MDGLREAGYILQVNRNRMILQNKKILLNRWITGYREILKPALLMGKYTMWNKKKINELTDKDFDELKIVLGGEPAAEKLTNYLQPTIITLYTHHEEKLLMPRLILMPGDTGRGV
jgi:hypothetical protein